MSRLAPPAAVLFDVGDTLLIEQRFDLESGIAAVVHSPADVRALAEAFRRELAACHQNHQELQLAAWLQARAPALAGHPINLLEDRIWPDVVTLTPSPGVARVLERLAHDRVQLAALSNAPFSGRVLMTELARHGLATHLQFVLASADVGLRKPAPALFRLALDRLQVTAETAWFVGDTVDEDIAGASHVGLTPFLLQRADAPRGRAKGYRVVRSWEELYDVYVEATGHSLRASQRWPPLGG